MTEEMQREVNKAIAGGSESSQSIKEPAINQTIKGQKPTEAR